MHYNAILTIEGKRTLAEFPDAPGCQTFAEPGEDIATVAREALEGWLELHLEDGDAPPRPRKRVKAPKGAQLVAVEISGALMVRLEIRWARQAAGLSQGELALRMGVSRQQVSLMESGKANLTIGTIEKVAKALGLSWVVQLGAPGSAKASA